MKKLCCFFNYNPLYRFPIYSKMAEELECDFYFGDSVFEPLKQFDPTTLKGFKKMLHTIQTPFKEYKWHQGIWPMFHGYSAYLITGQIDYIANWLLIIYAKLTGKHIYCWTHGVPHSEVKKPISRKIFTLFFKSMDGIFMYNHYNCQLLKELGIRKEKLYIINNSLDTNLQTQIYKSLADSDIYQNYFGNSLPTLIYIGRIQARKKLDLLIDALAIINTPQQKANLCIVGAPVDTHDLNQQIKARGQEKAVWFYGPCFKEEENAELLYNAAVCVCPAAVGLTAIHALSYGTPVISNDDFDSQMPEFEAIKKGVTGSFYKTGDTQNLAQEILYWINKSAEDRDIIRQMAREEVTAHWSVDYQMGIFKNVFQEYVKSV